MKYCPQCKLELDENMFNTNIARHDGYDSYCKSCRKNKYNLQKQNEFANNEKKYNDKTWKQIPNFNKYEASTNGNIRNAKTKRLIKGSVDGDGYLVSSLSDNNGKFINIKFHRIIAQTFIGNVDNKPTVNHKDKNKQNNDVSNLEFATHDEQTSHKYNTSPMPPIIKSEKKIIMYNNEISYYFNSLKEACKYIHDNNLCDKDERYSHNQIFNSIKINKLVFNYYWKYDNNNIDNELWKKWNDIEISNLGRVKDKFGYIMQPIRTNKNKYITIQYNKTFRLHRLVAELFVENPNKETKTIVNHIDGNKHNNTATNLEWVNSSENQKHAYRTGLQPIKKKIYQIDIDTNNIIKVWNNMKEIKNNLGLSKSGISYCLSGKYKTSYGYKWQYLD